MPIGATCSHDVARSLVNGKSRVNCEVEFEQFIHYFIPFWTAWFGRLGPQLTGLTESLFFLLRTGWSAGLPTCSAFTGFGLVFCDEESPEGCSAPEAASAHAGASGSQRARHPEASRTQNLVINRTLARAAGHGRKINKLLLMFH